MGTAFHRRTIYHGAPTGSRAPTLHETWRRHTNRGKVKRMLKIYITIASTGAGMAMSAVVIADYPSAARWLAAIGFGLAIPCLGGMLSEMKKVG